MDSSISLTDQIWFLRMCHYVSSVLYLHAVQNNLSTKLVSKEIGSEVSENRALRKVLGTKREELWGSWGKLHRKDSQNFTFPDFFSCWNPLCSIILQSSAFLPSAHLFPYIVIWTSNYRGADKSLARTDWKTIEKSPFFVQRGGHCCRRDLVERTTFWFFFLSGLQKLVWSV